MKKRIYLLFVFISILISFSFAQKHRSAGSAIQVDSIIKIDMFLNAFGVESFGFPSIKATINFKTQRSICNVTYYEPQLKSKNYSLSQNELQTISSIFSNFDFKQSKKEYAANTSDQPTSTTTIYTTQGKFQIKDYGLIALPPFDKLYEIVYKLKQNFR